jgi:uncharacterized protein YajQ (UPF0234 family)
MPGLPSFDPSSNRISSKCATPSTRPTRKSARASTSRAASSKVELGRQERQERELTLFADSDFQLEQVRDMLLGRLTKRSVDIRFLDLSAKPQKIGGDKLKQRCR